MSHTPISLVGEMKTAESMNTDDRLSIGSSFMLSQGATITANRMQIGANVSIGEDVIIECEQLFLGDGVEIGPRTIIKGSNIEVGAQTEIMDGNHIIVADQFQLGSCSTFGKNCTAICRIIEIGHYFHGGKEIDFGGGGRLGPNSIFRMGDYGFLGDRSIVNRSDAITIGDDVGIGAEVMLWTHGAYLSVLDGFPADFAPLQIGSHVWIPARSVILPGVTIGSNVVISIGSLVNRDIPDGVLVGGIPAKVIRENIYPKSVLEDKKDLILRQILDDYVPLLEYKGYETSSIVKNENVYSIHLNQSQQLLYGLELEDIISHIDPLCQAMILYFSAEQPPEVMKHHTLFNLSTLTIHGQMHELAEDLRDYMRRKGIKFYTNHKFASIIPPDFKRWL